MGANSGLTGAGLDLSYADNVIVRNLKISKVYVGEGDAITILASHNIWIDHCDLSSDRGRHHPGYDGLVDITHGSSIRHGVVDAVSRSQGRQPRRTLV